MTRRAAKVDANQGEIVQALRRAGATVVHLHAVGDGCPDIAVGYRDQNYFLEIKDGSKPPSAQKLTEPQMQWHRDWRGTSHVVNSPEAALAVIGVVPVVGSVG